MDTPFTQNLWLWMIAAFLLGVLVFALLDLFVFRRRTNANVNELEAMLGRRDSQLQESQDTLDQARGELKAKGQELQAALAARENAEKELADIRQQLAAASANLASAQAQLETNVNANANKLEHARGQIDTLVAQIQGLEAERAALQQRLAEANSHHDDATAQVEQLSNAAAADGMLIRDLDMSKTVLTEQMVALHSELEISMATLNAALLDKAEVENELAEFKVEMGRAREQIVRLENEDGRLASKVAQLTAGALAASELIKTLEGDKSALTEQVAQLQANLDSMTKGRALAEGELADLKLQLNKLDAVLGIAHKENANYAMQLATRVNEIDMTRTQLIQLREDNNALLGDIAKFTARAAAASSMAKGLDDEKRQLAAQVERLQRELTTAHAARVEAEARATANLGATEPTGSPQTLAPESVAGLAASNGKAWEVNPESLSDAINQSVLEGE